MSVRLSLDLYKFVSGCCIQRFILAQNFSIGFKSGDYGGKNISLQPTDFINFFVFCDLWKEALFITTTCPGFKSLIKKYSTQLLKRSVLQEPLKTTRSIVLLFTSPAILLVRS
ncbi:MAG: hypothetical protein NWR41_01210 [Rickettsiaceae bacterium]|nr:hypothetical protein [Rickettsiaceae bacterium]